MVHMAALNKVFFSSVHTNRHRADFKNKKSRHF